MLDAYSVLRYISEEQLEQEATIFPVHDALWYKPKGGSSGSQGVANFIAPNPPFGAVFTYYLSESYKTKKTIRKEEEKKLKGMQYALSVTPEVPGGLDEQLYQLKTELQEIEKQLYGNRSKDEIGEKDTPTFRSRLNFAQRGTRNITYGPTAAQKRSLEIAKAEFQDLKSSLDEIINNKMPAMEKALIDTGAPWLEGQ